MGGASVKKCFFITNKLNFSLPSVVATRRLKHHLSRLLKKNKKYGYYSLKLKKAIQIVNQMLNELIAEEHPDKTFIVSIAKSFSFLGYSF
jgi:hypothetical protein